MNGDFCRRRRIELVSDRLLLRPFRPSDLAEVHLYAGDPEVVRYLRWGPNDPGETRRFVMRAARNAFDSRSGDIDLAIVERATDRVRGGAAIHWRAVGRVEIGYVLARAAWGFGYATETVRTLLAFLEREAPGYEVFGLVVSGNEGSVRVLERCGFRQTPEDAAYREWMVGLCASARVYRTRLRGTLAPGAKRPEVAAGDPT